MPPQKKPLEEKYPGLEPRLGKEPDARLAKEYGLTASRVFQLRTEREIPPFQPAGVGSQSHATIANRVFHHLRDRWREETGKPLPELAKLLHAPPTRMADWAYGANARQPSWPVIFHLADMIGCSLTISGSGVIIHKGRTRRAAGEVRIALDPGDPWDPRLGEDEAA